MRCKFTQFPDLFARLTISSLIVFCKVYHITSIYIQALSSQNVLVVQNSSNKFQRTSKYCPF